MEPFPFRNWRSLAGCARKLLFATMQPNSSSHGQRKFTPPSLENEEGGEYLNQDSNQVKSMGLPPLSLGDVGQNSSGHTLFLGADFFKNKKSEEWKEMNSMKLCSVKLNDGFFMPVLGFGTFAPSKVAKSDVEEAVMKAIDVGYRHFDSAYFYLNEEEIGRAIRKKIADGSVMREDIFYTSKVWGTFFRPELVQTSLEMSLRKLQLSYVDLYLVHFPIPLKPGEELIPKDTHGEVIFDTVDFCSTWEAMERCKDLGLAKSIGVSNFNRKQLERILNKPGLKYKPVCNQVECHPYLNQSKLLQFCKSQDIVLTVYGALGSNSGKEWVSKDNPVLLEDPVLNAIAARHRRTPAQVALRYQLQRGVVPLAKSFNEKRIQENFQALDFQLTPEDMETLDGLNRNIRYFPDIPFSCHPEYPFFDEY